MFLGAFVNEHKYIHTVSQTILEKLLTGFKFWVNEPKLMVEKQNSVKQ